MDEREEGKTMKRICKVFYFRSSHSKAALLFLLFLQPRSKDASHCVLGAMKSFVINSHLETAAAAEQCEIGSLKRQGSFMDFKVFSLSFFIFCFGEAANVSASEEKFHR